MGRGGEQVQRAKGQKFSLAEVAKHRTPGDAWMVCRGKVYDVSPITHCLSRKAWKTRV